MTNPASSPSRHRPLLVLAAAMAVSTVLCLLGMIVDHRTITGLPLWDKPFKFSLSIFIYAVTWAWLIGQLRRARRWAWWAGTISAVGLALEMVIILGQAARHTTSHFNVSTPFDAAVWTAMGITIAFVWSATLIVSILLFASPGPDRARNLAIRYGASIALVGMSLGFLMTIPTAAQTESDGGILGAHTVGLADGGPGLPILGWSTVGGDLRIPHFVGMHALQLIPLVLLVMEVLGRRAGRFTRLADPALRARLITVLASGYAAGVGLVTWQALRGQSIVHPDGWTLGAVLVIATGMAGGVLLALRPTPVQRVFRRGSDGTPSRRSRVAETRR